MKFFYINDEVNYDKMDENTTVGELLEAINDYLEANPLNCFFRLHLGQPL